MGLKLSNAPQLFADGYVIPKQGFDVIASGNYNAVPMIFGSSSQEFATYALSANYYDSELNSDIIKKGWNMLSMIQSAKRFGSMYQSYYYIENNAEKFLASGIQPAIYSYISLALIMELTLISLWDHIRMSTNHMYPMYIIHLMQKEERLLHQLCRTI